MEDRKAIADDSQGLVVETSQAATNTTEPAAEEATFVGCARQSFAEGSLPEMEYLIEFVNSKINKNALSIKQII